MWITKLFRQLFMLLDNAIFWCIRQLSALLTEIASANIFGDTMQVFRTRIYTILGLFMLFKLSFAFIKYIISPDDLTSETKGVGNLIKKFAVMLVLIATTPWIFNFAYRIQSVVLSSNAIPAFILGSASESKESSGGMSTIEEAGYDIAYLTFASFLTPNTKVKEMKNCDGMWTDKNKASTCLDKISPDAVKAQKAYLNIPSESDDNGEKKVHKEDTQLMLTSTVYTKSSNDEFYVNYICVITTVAAGFVAYILLLFCFDIAIRCVKFGVLELIAPIPIMSYVDPKSSSDGMFQKWVKLCINTYLDLFIRLASIFFAMFIISRVTSSEFTDMIDNKAITNPFVVLFIIFGALLFARQLPGMLEQMGIHMGGFKDHGGMSLRHRMSPLQQGLHGLHRARGNAAMLRKKIGQVAAPVAGTLSGGFTGFNNAKNHRFLRGVAGAGVGFFNTTRGVLHGQTGKEARLASSEKIKAYNKEGQGFRERHARSFSNSFNSFMGMKTHTEQLESNLKDMKKNLTEFQNGDYRNYTDKMNQYKAKVESTEKLRTIAKDNLEKYKAEFAKIAVPTQHDKDKLNSLQNAFNAASNAAGQAVHDLNQYDYNNTNDMIKKLNDYNDQIYKLEQDLEKSQKLDKAVERPKYEIPKGPGPKPH